MIKFQGWKKSQRLLNQPEAMPLLSTRNHKAPFIPSAEQEASLVAIVRLIEAIRTCSMPAPSKKRMLVHALWEVARVSGNFYPRYRSKTVTTTIGLRIQRDHIHQKKRIVELLIANPDYQSSDAVDKAQCCIVTDAEHRELHRIDQTIDGFDRYRVAGIEICDMMHT